MLRKLFQSKLKEVDGRLTTQEHDIAKYFVPAETISEFVAPKLHFQERAI